MKYFLGFLSGFVLTVILFVSGAAFAVVYLSAEPVPVRKLNTASSVAPVTENMRVVDTNQGSSTFVSTSDTDTSRAALQAKSEARDGEFNSDAEIDPVTTASAASEPSQETAPDLLAAHVAWCSDRYRSYDPDDNRYTAYSGEKNECVSPFYEIVNHADWPEQATSITQISTDGTSAAVNEFSTSEPRNIQLDPDHIRSCFSRYRSYRLEDNSYQPYGGGPRRQCE